MRTISKFYNFMEYNVIVKVMENGVMNKSLNIFSCWTNISTAPNNLMTYLQVIDNRLIK